ncbi:sterile alpha motif domain containing 1a [Trichomycterus rosablanca]|uniref:sterile alpha motif domain containing 1a n=1 Tax=Trichomycterus rosablanca TaxID=2290929 RepID=UPI002F360A9F
MSEPRYREWILDTIDSLRSRKARPDLERICRMVRRRHGSEPDRTCLELDKLIEEQLVLKVNYKGSISYRNAAKVQRGKRKSEQAASKSAAKRALGPVDEEEMEDELSNPAGMDSSMDEEEASLDATCMQIQNTADSGISLSPIITDAEVDMTRASPAPSQISSLGLSTPEKERDITCVSPERTQPVAQQETGSLELEGNLQPAAICPSAQWSTLTREEESRAEESVLTPDQLLSNRTVSPHQDEAVGSDGAPHTGSDRQEEDKRCDKGEDVSRLQKTEPAKNGEIKTVGSVKAEEIAQDLLQWSVADVVSYFTAVGFPEQAVAFRTQEIDGKSLLLMQRSDVLTGLSIRLGPALKIYEHHVKVLQRSHFQEHSNIVS